jgi:predicted nuclease of predicted toxin-antitoxin system
MRFLVDECTGTKVADWLRDQGHDVFSVFDEARGISDDEVISRALSEDRILVTNDGDFGTKIFRDHSLHNGVVFLRLSDERAANKIAVLKQLLENHSNSIQGRFVVVTETKVRFRKV